MPEVPVDPPERYLPLEEAWGEVGLGTGSVLISDVAPDLKRERELRERGFLFGFGLPGHTGGRDTGRYDRHRASVPRRQP